MKRNVLLGIILSGSSLTAFAQSSDIQKPITITPNISIQNFDWFERSTVGKVGVQLQFKPTQKLNISVDGSVFKSIGNPTALYGTSPEISTADNFGSINKGPAYGANGQLNSTNLGDIKKSYQGAFINIDAGIPIKLGDSSRTTVEPFVGIEGKIWNRTVDYGTEGNPIVHEETDAGQNPSTLETDVVACMVRCLPDRKRVKGGPRQWQTWKRGGSESNARLVEPLDALNPVER